MKKILSIFLAVITLFSVFAFAGCNENEGTDENATDGGIDTTSAYYENGNLFVPIHLMEKPITAKTFIVNNDNYTWYIHCFSEENIIYEDAGKNITLENEDGIVVVSEEYANEEYIIKTNYNNLLYHMLIVRKENTEIAEDSAAYYNDGNLFIPINLAIKYNTYTVKSDKYTWYVRYSIGIVINHPFDMKEVTVECKNNIVTIPEKYANENYFLKTRCNNVATFILVTQKPNSGYIPEPEPDYPIIIR